MSIGRGADGVNAATAAAADDCGETAGASERTAAPAGTTGGAVLLNAGGGWGFWSSSGIGSR
jgi:hypothetical protein